MSLSLLRHMGLNAVLLGLFAIVGTGLVVLTYDATRTRIQANNSAVLLRRLYTLVPKRDMDNDPALDTIEVRAPTYLGSAHPMTVYRIRKDGKPVAAVLTTVAPGGYGGAITLLVAVRYNGTIAGVRIVSQHETPGLGDAIEADKSRWIYRFNGKSLRDPNKRGWAVKRDGGVFDQFTGATISPRAVVKAVHRALIYFKQHRAALFAPAPGKDHQRGKGHE